MLESVLADVLTRVLGQYLEGIDRDSVRFGAWSGLVELRGVSLRAEALAVLFETLGIELPVTVEAGFIGLLRLRVPWKSIGSTPVQIDMEDITIMARPVRGDGSDDSELELRERRIKRAKLDTDDAVREASWGVTEDNAGTKSWSTWLVSDQMRAKIIDNIQINLTDILLRFEDPFSDPKRPYIASICCKSIKAVSTNDKWEQAFVERDPDAQWIATRKLLEVEGFRIDWAPITPRNVPGPSSGMASQESIGMRFDTPDMLKQFMAEGGVTQENRSENGTKVKSLLHPVDGSLRLRFSAASSASASANDPNLEPPVDMDIRFPDLEIDLDDVQYACLLQTSVYFARLATRGIRPKTPKARWIWAINQLLPGFSARREKVLSFTPRRILDMQDKKIKYSALRISLLKARRMNVEEPKQITEELESMENNLKYDDIILFRDEIDEQIKYEKETWKPATTKDSTTDAGTTTSSFWRMLGYADQPAPKEDPPKQNIQEQQVSIVNNASTPVHTQVNSSPNDDSISVRVGFLLKAARIRLFKNGFPNASTACVGIDLRGFRVGVLFTAGGDLTIEAVLRSVEAWDIQKETRMVYSRLALESDSTFNASSDINISSYPYDVSDAIESIRSGSNPAKDLIIEDEITLEDDASSAHDPHLGSVEEESFSSSLDGESDERIKARYRARGTSSSRESTPTAMFRVTESEFLGCSQDGLPIQKYVAAFRYEQPKEGGQSSQLYRSKLDVSVATLEAVVDGPKGSFVWGLKFWQPKGMAQDPIMAFLGAAAGARIAELRMELEEALMANKVPMQINAVIRAPRFILPSLLESQPAIVVNMGTLGICTSDYSPGVEFSRNGREGKRLHYSNYVLTLDDLGVYFSPNLTTAVSRSLDRDELGGSTDGFNVGFGSDHFVDTSAVERIVHPFSLRFVLQTLRDSKVVQVAHSASKTDQEGASVENIAKVRVRGNIPGLYLVLTQAAFEHVIIQAKTWHRDLRPSGKQMKSPHPSGEGWKAGNFEESISSYVENNGTALVQEVKKQKLPDDLPAAPTTLASYDVKVLMQKVSVELRSTHDVRLVTAMTSKIQASVVKTGRKMLQASFRLRSWSVKDGSRGSTAAFRRLVYAGTFPDTRGVSPPRSSAGMYSDIAPSSSSARDFINIQYRLNLITNEQEAHFRFLSLKITCVRETYFRLASFFYQVYKTIEAEKKKGSTDAGLDVTRNNQSANESQDKRKISGENEEESARNKGIAGSGANFLVTSEFDGFSLQLVASGGAIAQLEMKGSRIHFLRDVNAKMKAWGNFKHFSVRDWTAPITEHSTVVLYENIPRSKDPLLIVGQGAENTDTDQDKWVLFIPSTQKERYRFNASFRGIQICFLYRFSCVLRRYFEALKVGINPILSVVLDSPIGEESDTVTTYEKKSVPIEKSQRFDVTLEFRDVSIKVPRHSGCSTEALTINTSRVEIFNSEIGDSSSQWLSKFSGLEYATNYVAPSSRNQSGNEYVCSPFMKDFGVEMTLQRKAPSNFASDGDLPSSLHIHMDFTHDVTIELCEAQYTVLYFVLTENLTETISGSEMSVDSSAVECVHNIQEEDADSDLVSAVDEIHAPSKHEHGSSGLQSFRALLVHVDISMASMGIEISRGWNIRNQSCKVLGAYLRGLKLSCKYSSPYHILFELAGKLISVADLRDDGQGKPQCFVAPLTSHIESATNSTSPAKTATENLAVTYEKENGNRPNIVISLGEMQVEIVPELFKDLTFLAIPGWPYLESSAYAPDVVYNGRTMTIVFNDSQVVLFAAESANDRRAVVVSGEFQLKVDWMRGTGSKTISLQSSNVEVSTSFNFPFFLQHDDQQKPCAYHALRIDKAETPLVYPTNSSIEYVAPGVDEDGCRLHMSIDSVLCLVSVTEIPLLRAVLSRSSRMKPSYLRQRNWKLGIDMKNQGKDIATDEKSLRKRKAGENMKLSVTIPAARYLITDEAYGRFVPVLETRLKSFEISAHMGNMFQVHVDLSMDLFNMNKGWWEPALESWPIAASLSHGQSGTRAIVLKAEKRLNLNITPTTIQAVHTVASSLKNATEISRVLDEQGALVEKESKHSITSLQSAIANRRPSVAAFLMRNELGFPIYMRAKNSSKREIVADRQEVEAGVQTDELLATSNQGDVNSRDQALKCIVTIPSFVPLELSAANIGIHPHVILPSSSPSTSKDNPVEVQGPNRPIQVIWEVEMSNGVPFCTLRSVLRLSNQTNSTLEFKLIPSGKTDRGEQIESVLPGETFSIPVHCKDCSILVRPVKITSSGSALGEHSETPRALFDWSPAFPGLEWLSQNVEEGKNVRTSNSSSSNSRQENGKHVVLQCQSTQGGSHDYFLALTAKKCTRMSRNNNDFSFGMDLILRAPMIMHNQLPGPLAYRVVKRDQSKARAREGWGEDSTVLAAGIIDELSKVHLYFSPESPSSTFMALAFENAYQRTPENFPTRFGPEISIQDLKMRKSGIVLPSAERSLDSKGQPRREFRATVQSFRESVSHLKVYSGFWIRNRSDVSLEVCSRESYYGSGGQKFFLRDRPPRETPDEFVCLEGPYISIGIPGSGAAGGSRAQPVWWTCPTVLADVDKPMSINLRGFSLEMEVSAPSNLAPFSAIITIRSSSWICNATSSTLQWCQTSALDSRGNCVTRLVKTMLPGTTHGIHWDQKGAFRAVHLRLAEEEGQSDWIWSPAIPMNIGHSRELPAKMYRPKTHEQYIARVSSKEVSGRSFVMVVHGEDRNNPPYRIVNLCEARAIAFSQIGSHERPWLVRAGKTTRYSWDNPLAPPAERTLSLHILEPEDLLANPKDERSSPSNFMQSSSIHEKVTLNIDAVGERVMRLSEGYNPAVVVNISVDGATKIVTVCEEDERGNMLKSQREAVSGVTDNSSEKDVPVMAWDDFGHSSKDSGHFDSTVEAVASVFVDDYPLKTKSQTGKVKKTLVNLRTNTDAALFLHSIGISVITKEPSELLYITFRDVLVNYESYDQMESLALHVGKFQIDNQQERTAYPVLMWVSTQGGEHSRGASMERDLQQSAKALSIEIHRNVTEEDILMIKSFNATILPISICFEDSLVSAALDFIGDTSIMGEESGNELLHGSDEDSMLFSKLLPTNHPIHETPNRNPSSRENAIPASRRVYVHNFSVHKTAVRLTSSGSGAAIAKAAGINSSARALVALILNVENCEFVFPSLTVQNVFDSVHHFAILVKEYYTSQVRNQRMKLLASNSFVGNPAALFDAVGTGARDFFVEPGKAKGSADFIASVGRGSKSLFANTVGGLVQSVGSIPRAVSSGLEKAVGDNDYLAERERIRGSNVPGSHRGSSSRNSAQGLATGALSFAHGISSGVTGFIREPVQGAKKGGAGGLLKGIGKAVIGGVAKPVAGAIDLVTEPAVGFSQQIVNSEQSGAGHVYRIAAPERPPRAFRGKNQQIDKFDGRFSVGLCIYNAVQLVSGVSYDSSLLHWIELSDRRERTEPGAYAWVWSIVQRYARGMPGTRKQIRSEEKASARAQSSLDVRPEKVRVALLTATDVIIATLDCKLVKSIPLWDDCVYDISGKGKEVIFSVSLKDGSSGGASDFAGIFTNAQGLIQAPWDASAAGRRVKPGVGQNLVDHISCGSSGARDELLGYLRRILKSLEDMDGARQATVLEDLTKESTSSSVELSDVTTGQDEDGLELKSTKPKRRSSVMNRESILPKWMVGRPSSSKSKSVRVREHSPSHSSSRRRGESTAGSRDARARQLSSLDKRVRRMVSSSTRRPDQKGTFQAVIANKLENGERLELAESMLDEGTWNIEPPIQVGSMDAEMFEAVCTGNGGFGRLAFRIGDLVREAAPDVAELDPTTVHVAVEFFEGPDGFHCGVQATGDLNIEKEERTAASGKVTIISVSRGADGKTGAQSGGGMLQDPKSTNESEEKRSTSLSADELSLQQLVEIGFKFEDAVVALAEANGDVVRAVDILTSK